MHIQFSQSRPQAARLIAQIVDKGKLPSDLPRAFSEGAKAAVMAARDRLLQRAAKIKNAEYKRCFLGVVREHVRTLARAGEWLL